MHAIAVKRLVYFILVDVHNNLSLICFFTTSSQMKGSWQQANQPISYMVSIPSDMQLSLTFRTSDLRGQCGLCGLVKLMWISKIKSDVGIFIVM